MRRIDTDHWLIFRSTRSPTGCRSPSSPVSPATRIATRIVYALAALFAAVLIVYLDRDGYRESRARQRTDPLSFLDCIYYATVSLSTTGYGDITPVTPSARLINVLVITPLRVAFLIVLIGTTVETLTDAVAAGAQDPAMEEQTCATTPSSSATAPRAGPRSPRWSATSVPPADIVVVDTDPAALERAKSAGLVTVRGSATDSEVLRLAGAQHAEAIIVATNRDDTAVLVTLTARELAPKAKIIAAIREGRKPASAPAVRRRLGGGVLGDRGPAARHREADAQRRRDDGGPADPRRGLRDRRTGGRRQGGRRLAAPPARHRAGRRPQRRAAARRRRRGRCAGTGRPVARTSAARTPSD